MLKSDFGDFNYVKCIVCLVVKGKEVILEPKSWLGNGQMLTQAIL